MAKDTVLTYLPTGWTEEKYKNSTDDDWEDLPEHVILWYDILSMTVLVLISRTGGRTAV
jgi:hypothetical protein